MRISGQLTQQQSLEMFQADIFPFHTLPREEVSMTYHEIEPRIWKPEKENDFIEGVLVTKQENVGENKSMLYGLETADGIKNVWGSTILDERMAFTKIGDKIKITFKGLAKDSKKGRNPAKIFKVEIDRD